MFIAVVEGDTRREWTVVVSPTEVEVNGPEGMTATRSDDGTEVLIEFAEPAPAVLLNRSASGFYRSAVDASTFSALIDQMEHLSAAERYGLLDDTWALVRSGDRTLDDLITILRALADPDSGTPETDPAVVRLIVTVGSALTAMSPDRPTTEAWFGQLLRPTAERLGTDQVPEDASETSELRGVVLGALGRIGDPNTVALAKARTSDHLAGIAHPAGLVAAAVGTAARTADPTLATALMDRYLHGDDAQDGVRCLQALGGVRDPEIMSTVLASTLDEVRSQDGPFLVRTALTNSDLAPMVWEFVTTNWEQLVNRWPTGTVVRMLQGITSFTDPALGQRVIDFLAEHPLAGREQLVAQHLERMQISIDTSRRLGPRLAELIP